MCIEMMQNKRHREEDLFYIDSQNTLVSFFLGEETDQTARCKRETLCSQTNPLKILCSC